MRKTLKRAISTALAALMLASVATAQVSANNGERGQLTFQDACEQVWNEQLKEGFETVEYMLYMPDEWKNEYNDYYVEGDPDSYAAGIYWWDSTAAPADCWALAKKGWPGYAVTRKAEDCKNVYIAEVPTDVPTVVWNNMVDGGMDGTQPWYTAAIQSADASVCGYSPNTDKYGFYPDGLDSMAKMIYVCNPDDTTVSAASQKLSYVGEWFYYYGNGEYGYARTKAEAGKNVWSNGEFPAPGLVMNKTKINTGIGGGVSISGNKTNTTAKVENEAIAKVEAGKKAGSFIVTGKKAGKTNVIFESFNEVTKETNKVTIPVTITNVYFDYKTLDLGVKDTEYNIGYGLGENVKITYSKAGIVTYDGLVVKAKKVGTTTVKCTQGGKTYSFKVNVKSAQLNKKSANLAAGKILKLKAQYVNGTAKFTSSKPAIAKVNKKTGAVTALKKGKTVITAKVGGKTLKCTINVTSNPKLASKSTSVTVNKTATVKITGAASKGDVKVSKCTVAKITAAKDKLTIKGTKKGAQNVTVTVNDVKNTLKVTVK